MSKRTVKLLDPSDLFGCDMCPLTQTAPWAVLARDGWLSHHVHGHDPIVLCGTCAELIAARRRAASETLAA